MTPAPAAALWQALATAFADQGVAPDLMATGAAATSLRAPTPRSLPVRRWLGPAVDHAPEATRALATAVRDHAEALQWGQSYRDGADPAFLAGYGWAEIVGRCGPIASQRIAAGVLLLAPETEYPRHHHPATEHYLPLSGTADWFDDDRGWRSVTPPALIEHRSGIGHAMRTGAQPMLAAYLWTGDALDIGAQFAGI